MTDAEINRALALAIGYHAEFVRQAPDAKRVTEVNRPGIYGDSWYRFDYRDPDVIWAIAERFDAFPAKDARCSGEWNCITEDEWNGAGDFVSADTAAKAVALAVIKSKGES